MNANHTWIQTVTFTPLVVYRWWSFFQYLRNFLQRCDDWWINWMAFSSICQHKIIIIFFLVRGHETFNQSLECISDFKRFGLSWAGKSGNRPKVTKKWLFNAILMQYSKRNTYTSTTIHSYFIFYINKHKCKNIIWNSRE